jgi:hypothetical protein
VNSIAVAGTVFGLLCAGVLSGLALRHRIPDDYLSPDSKDVIKLATGLVGTLTALVLGLLIATAKSSYDAKNDQIKQITAQIIFLDASLVQYGPEARMPRENLRGMVDAAVDRIWSEAGNPATRFEQTTQSRALYDAVHSLSPNSEAQKAILARLNQIVSDLAQSRLQLFTHAGSSIPLPFLAVMAFWLVMIFAGFGLLVRANPVVIVALLICALSVSGAIFLILEMDQPFKGTMQIDSTPLRNALARLGPAP